MFNHIKSGDALAVSIQKKNNNNDISQKSLNKIKDKIILIKNSVASEVFKKNMDSIKVQVSEMKSHTVSEKINKVINACLTKENQSNQSASNEVKNEAGNKVATDPKFSRIRSSHTIEEAILLKVVFNGISQQSLNKIETKIKNKLKEMISSQTPELFEREMLNAQSILKKYDNEVVCEEINKIINKYLDKYERFICEGKTPLNRICYAIQSVEKLQSITPRKLNEFKMAIIDSFKYQPIESIDAHSEYLIEVVFKYTHENIKQEINGFIELYAIDRAKELKGDKQYHIESNRELLNVQRDPNAEELMETISVKKIFSHLFSRLINNIRKIFSRN